jgi:hypothetical protein
MGDPSRLRRPERAFAAGRFMPVGTRAATVTPNSSRRRCDGKPPESAMRSTAWRSCDPVEALAGGRTTGALRRPPDDTAQAGSSSLKARFSWLSTSPSKLDSRTAAAWLVGALGADTWVWIVAGSSGVGIGLHGQ